MVVPTGTSTPWREVTPLEAPEYTLVYLKDGWETLSADLLAEAVRADGVTWNLGSALRMAEDAQLEQGWYGYVDGGFTEYRCDEEGETSWGDRVDEIKPGVFAYVYVYE